MNDTQPNQLELIMASGLFDVTWYSDTYTNGPASAAHYLTTGSRRGWRPNPYFDPGWYAAQNPGLADQGLDPLGHYILQGEREGRAPIAWFDPAWYAQQYQIPLGRALRHFLEHRRSGQFSPIPEFDACWYVASNSDVREAGIDPFEHYLVQGFREGRRPNPQFDSRVYAREWMSPDDRTNPLIHWRAAKQSVAPPVSRAKEAASVFGAQRFATAPGPHFEAEASVHGNYTGVRLLAFYLPQFHAIAENDMWWGKGFTDWRNVARAMPRFAGHYQPRTPRDLGFYDLSDSDVLHAQVKLARNAGLGGFVFYYYRFSGRRVLEAPVEKYLADRSIEFPFCLMWANENWSRRWDGSEQEILLKQDHDIHDDDAMIADFARHFRDPRYIRVSGRPLLFVYRPGIIPDCAARVARWRGVFQRQYGMVPLFVMAQCFGDEDPDQFGFDLAVEFPPHGLQKRGADISDRFEVFDPEFSAQVYSYAEIAEDARTTMYRASRVIPTVCPSWDNDARRQGKGLVLHGSTPDLYQSWLETALLSARHNPDLPEPIVCINAWNEWAEGAYLEPDVHFGSAYLNATGRALARIARDDVPRILLVGHDAFNAGAQQLLLHIGMRLRSVHGACVEFLLLGDGELRGRYEAVAPTIVLSTQDNPDQLAASYRQRGFGYAVVNSIGSARLCRPLTANGIRTTQLVHELPRLIERLALTDHAREAAACVHDIVFPCLAVRDAFMSMDNMPDRESSLLPQGTYRPVHFQASARRSTRKRLGVTSETVIVIGVGYGDMRKGFDLFLQLISQMPALGAAMGIWLGEIDSYLHANLKGDIDALVLADRLVLPGHRDHDIGDYLSAADVFASVAREDPYPTAVLEAISTGLPVLAFEGAGGAPELIKELACGAVVPALRVPDMAARAVQLGLASQLSRRRTRQDDRFDFGAYVRSLLGVVVPALPRISAVVLSANYERYMQSRLSSIFRQKVPLHEIIVIDDHSSDSSVDLARKIAADFGREVRIIASDKRSGRVMLQWEKAIEAATGDYLWIAEADDHGSDDLLAVLINAMRGRDIVMAFADSAAIDQNGDVMWNSHADYYRSCGAEALLNQTYFPAREFAEVFLRESNLVINVSATLWRRTALADAFRKWRNELVALQAAGDWLLYFAALHTSEQEVAFVNEPLNYHRRHALSVTSRTTPDARDEEIRFVAERIQSRVSATGLRAAE